MLSSVTLVLFCTCVFAYSDFQTTCATPPPQTNFVYSPDTRGTLDILWGCVFTIIACTWTIQHLNVPEQPSFDPQMLTGYEALRWKLRGPLRSLKWMLVTIIAPECVLGKALADLYAARLSVREMRRYAKSDVAKWGLTHAFFANMGGFVLTQKLEGNANSDDDHTGGRAAAAHANQDDLENEALERNSIKVAGASSNQRTFPALLSTEEDALNKRESKPGQSCQIALDEIPTASGRLCDTASSGLVSTREQPQQTKRQFADSRESHIKDSKYILQDPRFPWHSFLPRCRIGSMGDTVLGKLNVFQMVPKPSVVAGESTRLPNAQGGRVSALGNNVFESKLLKGTTAQSKYRTPFHLLASEIYKLRESGALPQLPSISTSEISDKSKGDMFLKVITASQVLWFILQVIVRAIRHLSISQLEVAVTAFGVCAIITYLLILPKPKSVDVPITLKEFQDYIPVDNYTFHGINKRVLQTYVRALFVPGEDLMEVVQIMGSHIPNDATSGYAIIYGDFGIAIGGVIFGAIHIAAWNFSFPTPVEQTLWRAASIMSTALLPLMYLPLALNQFVFRARFPNTFIKLWDVFFAVTYIVVRTFLLVEVFRTLFYLPEDAYLTTWAANVPHVT